MDVRYVATDDLPAGIPAAVVAGHGSVTVLVARGLSVDQVCMALAPLINEHAQQHWVARAAIA